MDHFDCIKPLTFITQIFGIGSFYVKKEKHREKPRELYTKKSSLIIAFVILCLICCARASKEYRDAMLKAEEDEPPQECFLFDLLTYTAWFETYFCLFLLFIVYAQSFRKRFELMEAHSVLNEIDITLQRFNYDIPYKKIRKFSIATVAALIAVEIGLICMGSSVLTDDYVELIYNIIEVLPNIIYTINIGIFVNFMYCLKYRYRALNDLLIKNSKQYLTSNTHETRLLTENELDALTKLHERVCDVSDTVSDSFGSFLLATCTYLFVLIVVQVFVAMRFVILGSSYQLEYLKYISLLLLSLTLIYGVKLGFIVYSTELVIGEASKTHAFVHKSINCYEETQIRNRLTIFLMQLINRKPTFTACGLFEINLPLLFSMVGALFTYVIILIQFDQSDKGCIPKGAEVDNSTEVANATETVMKLLDNMGVDTMNTTEASMKLITNITKDIPDINKWTDIFGGASVDLASNLTNLHPIEAATGVVSDLAAHLMHNASSLGQLQAGVNFNGLNAGTSFHLGTDVSTGTNFSDMLATLTKNITDSAVQSISNVTESTLAYFKEPSLISENATEAIKNSTKVLTHAFMALSKRITETLQNMTDTERLLSFASDIEELVERNEF